MLAYLIRRLLYAVPIVMGVVLVTFVLFFVVNRPEHMAQRALGPKATPEAIKAWVSAKGYDLPRFYNGQRQGLERVTATLFWQKAVRVLALDLGRSDTNDRDVAGELRRRMGPSLAIAVPNFLLGMAACISTALIVAFCRGTYLDRGATLVCVLMMSVSMLFYIIGGQFVLAKWLRLFPISGFGAGESMLKFVVLPVVIGAIAGYGSGVRFYRTVMLEEIGKDYVRTARAKGLGEGVVLFRHVLKNAMIPILTNAVMVIPFLFLGSLLTESFFAIPGLGSMTMDAIHSQDFAVVRAMTFLGAVLFVIGQILTDLSYTLVDPRITLGGGDTRTLYGQPTAKDVAKILASFAGLMAVAGLVYLAFTRMPRGEARVPVLPNLVLLLVLAGLAGFGAYATRNPLWRSAWKQVRRNRLALAALGVLGAFVLVAVADSITWSDVERPATGSGGTYVAAVYAPPQSLLDRVCRPLASKRERTYSAPLATHLFAKETVEREVDGQLVRSREFPPLQHPGWHLMGTDKTGRDVFYLALKGVRTGLIVGGLTTLIAVPFALFFGVLAGFFGGWVDDLVQYVYGVLHSIPWVLLVVCFMLVFGQGLAQVCVVMGLTGWVGLCRLLRGETLKLREKEYVQAALALGVSKFAVLRRHIVPNLMHLVLISVVLQFSGLVLAEAVLSYIGVGVGAETQSWGSMINQARSELGREPMVWWSLAAAFVAMFALVLPANLFGDALRDALDPSLRVRGEEE